MPNWTIVASYAAGLFGMTRNLALDLKPLRVNAVSPGLLDTNLWKDMAPEAREGMYKAAAEKLPTEHVGKAEEVAHAYLWLMNDTNVTGEIVHSDSGSRLV